MLSGRDLTINNYNGLSPAQAVEIAEQVVSRELARFSIEAQQEISRRVEAMRVELIERIGQFDKASLDAFRDPDVQALLGEAQVSYARSGRDDVRRTLVDLVVARCSASPGGLEAIVTAEAIEVVRKVTRGGMAILTVSFLVARVRNMAINNLQDLDNWAARNILPFIDEVPANQAEYLHLVSSGTAQISLGERQIVPLLAETYPGVFQQGISQDEISPLLWELHEQAGNLFMPCLISEGTLQVAALDKEIAAQRIPATASPELREQYQSLLDSNLVPDRKD